MVTRIGTILLSVVAASIPTERADEGGTRKWGFPPIRDVLSMNEKERSGLVRDFRKQKKEWVAELLRAVKPQGAGELRREQRATACFLLAELRASDPEVISALIEVVDQSFVGEIKRIPDDRMDPAAALVVIGNPAVGPVVEAIATTDEVARRGVLRWVLSSIEGRECASVRIRDRLVKEQDPVRRARLEDAMRYFAAPTKGKGES